jgi:hypothetical protein
VHRKRRNPDHGADEEDAPQAEDHRSRPRRFELRADPGKEQRQGEGALRRAATELLASGAVVWLGNNLSFALLYWLIDSGGPIARLRQTVPVDFAFTQQMSSELAPPGWRPIFLDYLHLGFTNATAFSPTDVMPLTHLAK